MIALLAAALLDSLLSDDRIAQLKHDPVAPGQ
jgi:hypothetical protein